MFIEPTLLPDRDKELIAIAIWCESHKIPFMAFMKRASLEYIRLFEKADPAAQTIILAFELNPEQWPILDQFRPPRKEIHP